VGLLRKRPPRVEKLSRKGNAEGLVRALHYEDPVTDSDGRVIDLGTEVRIAAAAELARMDSPVAREGLHRALADPDESVRLAVIGALRTRDDHAAVGRLAAAAATWTEPELARAREAAVEALASTPGALRRTAALLVSRGGELDASDAAVIRHLKRASEPEEVRDTVADLADGLGEGSTSDRASTLLVWLAPESVDMLIEALRDPEAQRGAALALGGAHDARAVGPLSELLAGSGDAETRQAAAWALGEIRDTAAVDALLVATGDDDFDVRAAAGDAFDKLGSAAVAIGLSALVLPALENGAGASEPAPPPAPPERVALPPGQPPPQSAPARNRARPTVGGRTSPLLRRLLGRQ
jgi:HEAT repeat protein